MQGNQAAFQYSEGQIIAIERSISPNRLNSYIVQAGGDRVAALRLYEQNTALSEALYGVIQGLEITLRNSVHRALENGTNETEWYNHLRLEAPEAESLRVAKESLQDLHKPLIAPLVISRISFGFWVRLTASTYEKELWVPHLHKIFPLKMMRTLLYKRLLKIKELRNQIAHHERISTRNLKGDYADILETIKWICPVTSNWVKNTNRFENISKQ